MDSKVFQPSSWERGRPHFQNEVNMDKSRPENTINLVPGFGTKKDVWKEVVLRFSTVILRK